MKPKDILAAVDRAEKLQKENGIKPGKNGYMTRAQIKTRIESELGAAQEQSGGSSAPQNLGLPGANEADGGVDSGGLPNYLKREPTKKESKAQTQSKADAAFKTVQAELQADPELSGKVKSMEFDPERGVILVMKDGSRMLAETQ